jgi:phospholipid/cholesterol/gamma-HCH transport system ATP-binding protein
MNEFSGTDVTDALVTEALTVRFDGRTVLDRVSLRVKKGEIFVIMGPSGCGKTTLLKCLVRLLMPTEGKVFVEGRDLDSLDEPGMEAMRRATGMVFQGGALLNSISLRENVALPLRAHAGLPTEMVAEVVCMRLAQVGLLDAADRMPSQLSGGMRKRAGIARALALDPRLLFFDEPTSGLDPITSDGIDNLVLDLRRALGMTIVVVTHDLPSAAKIADHLIVLGKGRVLVTGTWSEVQGSTDPEVRAFLDRKAPDEPQESAGALGLGGVAA